MAKTIIDEIIASAFESGYINGTWAHNGIAGYNSREPYKPEDIKQAILKALLDAKPEKITAKSKKDFASVLSAKWYQKGLDEYEAKLKELF